MKKGFVTFLTPNYESISKVLVDSVLEFSKYPIIVCGVDYLPSFINHERVIFKKIINPNSSIMFQKLNCILSSGIKKGIYLEADDIVNYKIDELFNSCPTGEFPTAPTHPLDPNNQKKFMEILGVKRKSQKYVHGHILFNNKCLPFIQECYDVALKLYDSGLRSDEMLFNIMLWKYKRTDTCTKYVFDPFLKCLNVT